MTVTLDPVPPDDHDPFFAMFDTYHRELDAFDPHAAEGGWDPVRGRAAILEDMDDRELFWILDGPERAGFIMTRTLPDWPDESREVCSIAEFYVVPSVRRRGVGRAAVVALLVEHRRRGTFEVEAGILPDNAPARAFWASLGFEVRSIVTARRP